MAGLGLTPGDLVMIGMGLKFILDMVSQQMGRRVTIDELPQLIADQEVRRAVLDAQRRAMVAKLDVPS